MKNNDLKEKLEIYDKSVKEHVYKAQEINKGIEHIKECWASNVDGIDYPSQNVKDKANIFLWALISLRNFKLPAIFPTFRNTIQFEWEFFPNKEVKDQSDYLEFEIYEDKISMLYVNTTGEFGGLLPGEYYNYSCNFKSDEKIADFVYLFRLFDKLEKNGDRPILRFLELFTMDYSKGGNNINV